RTAGHAVGRTELRGLREPGRHHEPAEAQAGRRTGALAGEHGARRGVSVRDEPMNPGSLESRLTLQQQGLAVLVVAAFAFSALWITRATLYREETQALQAAAARMALSIDLEFAGEHDLGKAID